MNAVLQKLHVTEYSAVIPAFYFVFLAALSVMKASL